MQAGLQLKKEDRISDKEYPYREFDGSIMFSANTYRPDLLYSISYPALYSGSHNSTHWKHAMRLMRYIKGTVNDVLIYTRSAERLQLRGFWDASFATAHDGRSTTGFLIYLNDDLIVWKSSKQKTVALSSAEAEVDAAVTCIKEL